MFYVCARNCIVYFRVPVKNGDLCYIICARYCRVYFKVPAKNGGLCFIYVLGIVLYILRYQQRMKVCALYMC